MEQVSRNAERLDPGGMRSAVRSLWGLSVTLTAVASMLVLGVLVVVVAFFHLRTADRISIFWCRLILWTSRVRVDVVGRENVSPETSHILVANHQGYFDIFGLVDALGVPPRFVTKKELARIPVFGRALHALGHIVIDRGDPDSAKRAIDRAVRAMRGGIQICFFAEGTRSSDGRMGPFKKGAAALGLQTGLPLVPVSISGARRLMPKGSRIVHPGGRMRIVFGKPIATDGVSFEERDAITQRLRDLVISQFDPSI